MTRIIDARGKQCPQPVIETKRALGELKAGTLEILADNAIAVQNLIKLAAYEGLACRSEQTGEKEFRVWMTVGETGEDTSGTDGQGEDIETAGDSGNAEKAEEKDVGRNCMPDRKRAGCVVAIGADHMGEGDPVLGRLLMKGFVYSLTQLDRLPETILLYNGGATLSVEGAETLEDLKTLEAQGVEIMTCGTCLNHYGWAEKLAVGSVTNMYVIAEKLTGAACVIRP